MNGRVNVAYVLDTAPEKQPVGAPEAKLALRIDADEDDAYLTDLLKLAVDVVQTDLRRQLITATWKLYLDAFPSYSIEIRKCPVQSIGSITYLDGNGSTQTLSAATYVLDGKSAPCRVVPAYGNIWPSTRLQPNAVCITFDAGYGDEPDDVPEGIKQLVKLVLRREFDGSDVQRDYDRLIEQFQWTV